MTLLGLDTATPSTAVAVLRADGEAFESRDDPGPGERPGHATRLLELVEAVLSASATGWEDLTALAVGTGPGSFTGLRIGVATGRALAQARGLPLVGVSTLAALAAGAEGEAAGRPVLATVDARRGEAFAAVVRAADGRRPEARALDPGALAELVGSLESAPLAVGGGAVQFRAQLEPAGAIIPPDASPLHLVAAQHVCRVAAERRGDPDGEVTPDYLRPPDAEIPARGRRAPKSP